MTTINCRCTKHDFLIYFKDLICVCVGYFIFYEVWWFSESHPKRFSYFKIYTLSLKKHSTTKFERILRASLGRHENLRVVLCTCYWQALNVISQICSSWQVIFMARETFSFSWDQLGCRVGFCISFRRRLLYTLFPLYMCFWVFVCRSHRFPSRTHHV